VSEITVDVVAVAAGFEARVTVRGSSDETSHTVTVSRDWIERVAPGAEPAALVRESFAFLLEREPKESILRAFDIAVIAGYFPEYEGEIVRRMQQ
jgi:hypothetical protein